MASNPYVNKVQKADGTTLIDLTSDTAVASDVASGKYFHLATGERVAGTASGGGLPSGYTSIPCVIADGNQYIDTGIVPDANTKVECGFLNEAPPSWLTSWVVFGCAQFKFISGAYYYTYGAAMAYFSRISPYAQAGYHLVTKTATSTSLTDRTVATETVATTAGSPSYTMTLFASHEGAATYQNYASARIFSCRIWNGNTLQRDFVPAVNSNDVAGLYDLVTGTFYTSDTATALIAGRYDDFLVPATTKSITANGTYDVTPYATATVNVAVVTYYTGSGTPSSSLGSNGDIYLQTGS